MKITVERSGGFAGMTRTWTVQPAPPDDKERWEPLIEACPWDAIPASGRAAPSGQADRFTYSIRAGQHRAILPEQALTGPWRDLVEHAKAAAESGRAPGGGPANPPANPPPAARQAGPGPGP